MGDGRVSTERCEEIREERAVGRHVGFRFGFFVWE